MLSCPSESERFEIYQLFQHLLSKLYPAHDLLLHLFIWLFLFWIFSHVSYCKSPKTTSHHWNRDNKWVQISRVKCVTKLSWFGFLVSLLPILFCRLYPHMSCFTILFLSLSFSHPFSVFTCVLFVNQSLCFSSVFVYFLRRFPGSVFAPRVKMFRPTNPLRQMSEKLFLLRIHLNKCHGITV